MSLQTKRRFSISEDRITFLDEELVRTKPILSGDVGKGFNIVTGISTEFLFQSLRIKCMEGQGEEQHSFVFNNVQEFLRESTNRVGISTFEKGMFSLCGIQSRHPFLCDIENVDKAQHFILSVEQYAYGLALELPGSISRLLREEERKLKENPFSLETKAMYYSFIEKYGTHLVKNAYFGQKAEMRWSLRSKSFEVDALSKITKNLQNKQKFEETFKLWRQTNFDTVGEGSKKVKKNTPKNCDMSMRVTTGLSDQFGDGTPVQISFNLQPIHQIFDEESVRSSMEIAVRLYIEEMRPKNEPEDFKDGDIVALYSIDNSSWISTDDRGHLFANSLQLGPENKFEVRRKGNKVGLKSLKFQNKYLSKALMRSIFHFHRLQFMGPYESFEVNGDYLIIGANIIDNAGFLYLGEENQIHVSDNKKNRIFILNANVRNAGDLNPDEVVEPLYVEEETMSISSEISAIPPNLRDTPKANSTSSLFIKDTIILPNVDELTRCMALQLHDMIKEGHSTSKLNILDIFNEDIYPLTKSVPKLHNMKIPSVETIFHFLNTIFKVEKLSPEPGIMALVYIDRVIEKTKMHLHAASWRRLVLASLIIASKVWEDQSVWTVDFLELFPSANIKDLNRLEQHILAILEFSVSIKASEYVRHYFELRSFMKSNFSDRGGKPLNQEALHKLEVRSASSEEEWKAPFMLAKSQTSTSLIDKKKHGLGVLS